MKCHPFEADLTMFVKSRDVRFNRGFRVRRHSRMSGRAADNPLPNVYNVAFMSYLVSSRHSYDTLLFTK